MPQIIIPFHTFFRLTYNDHFLFFKLMDSINSTFLDSMSSLFLTEAWRIAGECLRKLILCPHWEEGLTGATRVNIIKPVYTELPSTTVAEFSGKLTVSHKVKD